jgi:hypothetical protein
MLSEVIAAVSPRVARGTASWDAARPWRVLQINRAIVATRSHQTSLMEEAFDALAEPLPEEAGEFFRQGMGQTEAVDYPSHVRAVMQSCHARWPANRPLLH